jgi:hypothetical protein
MLYITGGCGDYKYNKWLRINDADELTPTEYDKDRDRSTHKETL